MFSERVSATIVRRATPASFVLTLPCGVRSTMQLCPRGHVCPQGTAFSSEVSSRPNGFLSLSLSVSLSVSLSSPFFFVLVLVLVLLLDTGYWILDTGTFCGGGDAIWWHSFFLMTSDFCRRTVERTDGLFGGSHCGWRQTSDGLGVSVSSAASWASLAPTVQKSSRIRASLQSLRPQYQSPGGTSVSAGTRHAMWNPQPHGPSHSIQN